MIACDRHPSGDEEQGVCLDLARPDVGGELDRRLPPGRWLPAVPHYVAPFFLYLGAIVVVIVAWFAILLTGRYPRGLFQHVEGVIRWHDRVIGHAFAS
jgi:hypothetical protein